MIQTWFSTLLFGLLFLPLMAQPQVVSIHQTLDLIYKERKSEEFRLDGAEFAKGTVYRTRESLFVPDGFELIAEDLPSLDSLVRTMRLFPNLRVEVKMCFSDSARAASLGKLDRQRASVVRDYFIRKGISAQRIRAVSGGAQYPLIDPLLLQMVPDPVARQKWSAWNERLEFTIITPAFGY
jgi:outer membrane protein OmpA-like peptidoglycan-associated protein